MTGCKRLHVYHIVVLAGTICLFFDSALPCVNQSPGTSHPNHPAMVILTEICCNRRKTSKISENLPLWFFFFAEKGGGVLSVHVPLWGKKRNSGNFCPKKFAFGGKKREIAKLGCKLPFLQKARTSMAWAMRGTSMQAVQVKQVSWGKLCL